MAKELIREIAKKYYARKDVQHAIISESRDREVSARYLDNFGKRPDVLLYESDIAELAKRGATSFHCSVERWKDPLKLRVDMTKKDLDSLRIAWDLILDIDCKFVDYSKTTAELLAEAFYFHNIHNFGVKFSGGTGFHLSLAFETFPKIKKINNIEINNFFPEGARLIASYLKEMIKPHLASRILEKDSIKEIAARLNIKPEELVEDKDKNKEYSKEKFDPFKIVELDTVLISSRHLFRMPYSLNEKTSLTSIVIKPENLSKFSIVQAKPSNIEIFEKFIVNGEENEAHELFIQSLDYSSNILKEKISDERFKETRQIIKVNRKLTQDDFSQCIRNALKGMQKDGRKRALFILINFFRSLGLEADEYEEFLREWNKKNYQQLKPSYLEGQFSWYRKQKQIFPPPNCSHPIYKAIGIYTPECERIKNPLNYTARKLKERSQEREIKREKEINRNNKGGKTKSRKQNQRVEGF